MRDDDNPLKSKSQLKREHLALNALGRKLIELPDGLLKRLPLTDRVREEVLVGRKLQRGALQRQLRHLAGVLVDEDHQLIRTALKAALEPGVNEIRRLHELEALRDALLRDGDAAIDTLSARYPGLDHRQLRQLVRNAREAQARESSPRAVRQLFQFLKLHAVAPVTDTAR
jgi:ribosome-associated protein